MSKPLPQELNDYLKSLAELRRLYAEDGTITPDEQSRVDVLEGRINQLLSATGSSNAGNGNGQFSAPPRNTLPADGRVRADSDPSHGLDSIEIYPEDVTLTPDEDVSFSATGNYIDGPNQILTSSVDWRSSNEDVVSINLRTGIATGKSVPGTAQITAVLDGVTSNVANVRVAGMLALFIRPERPRLNGGDKLQLEAFAKYPNNQLKPLKTGLSWKSSKEGIIDLNPATGQITAKHVTGKTDVTVRDPTRGFFYKVTVEVSTAKLTGITVTPANNWMLVGKTLQFEAMGKFSDNHEQHETEAVRWEAEPPEAVSIDAKGLATARQLGKVQIKATDPNDASVSGYTWLTIKPNKVTAISILPDDSILPPGEFQVFQAWGDIADESNLRLDGQVEWSAEHPEIVHINAKDGTAYGRRSGSTTIYARYTLVNENRKIEKVTGETKVTVPALESINIEPASASLVVDGQLRFKVMGQYAKAKSLEINGADWRVIGNAATVDRGGLVTGRVAGSAVIKATYKDFPAEAKVTVALSEALQSIRIDTDHPASFDGTIVRGQRRQFRAAGLYSVGSGKEQSRPIAVDWESDNEKAVSIDANGLASALALGKAMLSATDKSGKTSAFITIRVTESDSSSVSSADKSKLPEAVVKPYDAAKAKYQNLLTQVRQLDSIPKLVQSLESIVKDIAKNPNRVAVEGAKDTKDLLLGLEGVDLQVKNFKDRVESAKNNIDASERATAAYQQVQELKELRQKGEEAKKNIKFILETMKSAASLDPLKGLVGMFAATEERFGLDAHGYATAIAKAERALDADTLKNIGIMHRLAERDLKSAEANLADAKSLAKKYFKQLESRREQAEADYDKKAAKGSFRFSNIATPLRAADQIVATHVPETRKLAEVSTAAIRKHEEERKSQNLPKIETLKAMADDGYGWALQAKNIGGQTSKLRQRLQEMRDKALDALADTKFR
jgi:hypothetical protein